MFQSLLKEKEQRDSMIITSAKGNLTVKSNAFGAKGRVFLQPVRYANGQVLVRTGGNIPASFHIEKTTNRLITLMQTEPLTPRDIEYWHSHFTNVSGPVNVFQPQINTPQATYPQQPTYTQAPIPQPASI